MMSGVSGAVQQLVASLFKAKDASSFGIAYRQMNMYQMRWEYCMGLGGRCNMEAPGDAVRSVLGHSEGIEGDRVGMGTD